MTDEELKEAALDELTSLLHYALGERVNFDYPLGLTDDQQETYWSYIRNSRVKVVFDE